MQLEVWGALGRWAVTEKRLGGAGWRVRRGARMRGANGLGGLNSTGTERVSAKGANVARREFAVPAF